jgi:hypothetical protein
MANAKIGRQKGLGRLSAEEVGWKEKSVEGMLQKYWSGRRWFMPKTERARPSNFFSFFSSFLFEVGQKKFV